MPEIYHSGQTLDCIVEAYDRECNQLSVSVKETVSNPYDGASFRHPVHSHRQNVIAGKYGEGVFCNLPDGVTVMFGYGSPVPRLSEHLLKWLNELNNKTSLNESI